MNKQLFEYHPVIGYRFIPNIQARVQHEGGGYLVRANSLGFRSEMEFRTEKTENKKRILLFGDSYTAADGVSNKKRYSDVLMQMLPGVEIYNFGMPGTGTDQQYLIYKEYAKNIEHDLVMIVVLVENIRRVNAAYRYYTNEKNEIVLFQKPYFELNEEDLILKNIPVNPHHLNAAEMALNGKIKIDKGGRFPALRRLINKTKYKETIQKLVKYQPLPEYKRNSRQWLLMKRIMLKWFSELKKPILLVPLPMHHYIEDQSDYTEIEKRFAEFSNINNLTLFNPIDKMKSFSLAERRKFRFEHDEHPSPYGHETYARIFKPRVEEVLQSI